MTDLDPQDTRLLVRHMRDVHGWDLDQFAAHSGVDRSTIHRGEKGDRLTRKTFERLAAGARFSMKHIEERLLPAFRASRLEALGPVPPEEVAPVEDSLAQSVAASLVPVLASLETSLDALSPPRKASALPTAEDRAGVPALAERFRACDTKRRALRVERDPEFHTWAFSEWLAHESERVAADDAREALALAELAVWAAEQATAEDKGPWRPRLLAYVWIFLANAQRVGNDFNAAKATVRKARSYWLRGTGSDPAGLLAEWRFLDRQAALERDVQNFPQALDLHARALALAPGAKKSTVLLSKSATLERMADFSGAVEALEEAAPLIDFKRDPRNGFGLLFNLAACLCRLGRASEASALLPDIRALAFGLGNQLDAIRLRWLEGRVAAGLGQSEEARAAFDQVRSELESLELPHDCAQATLDLALLYREQQRWPEIRTLAMEMAKIFEEHKIHREARAAVALFREAALKESVTVELVRRLQDYLHLAERRPGLRFEGK